MNDNSFKDALNWLNTVERHLSKLGNEISVMSSHVDDIDPSPAVIRQALTICDRLKNGELSEKMDEAIENALCTSSFCECQPERIFNALSEQLLKEIEKP